MALSLRGIRKPGRSLLSSHSVVAIQKLRGAMRRLGRLKNTSSLYHAARSMLGDLSHKQFAPAWEFFKSAEAAADGLIGLEPGDSIDPFSAPLVRGMPEFGDGLKQFRAQAFVEFTDPGTGLRRTITVNANFSGTGTQEDFTEGVFEAAGEYIEKYEFAKKEDFEFDDTLPELTLQWIVRRF